MENSVGTFRTDRLMQGDRPSQVTVNTGSTVSVNEFCRLTLPLRQRAVSSQQRGMVSLGLVMESENASLPLKEVPVRVEENGYILKLDCSMLTTTIYLVPL